MGRIEKLVRYALDPSAAVDEARNAWLLALAEIRRAGLDRARLARELGLDAEADADAAAWRQSADAAEQQLRERNDWLANRLRVDARAYRERFAELRAEVAELQRQLADAQATVALLGGRGRGTASPPDGEHWSY